jgi:coproporphyrinogen III oxidase-like Fe-S oxidoreductase
VTTGGSPVEHEETLTPEQRELERVYLALRTAEGLDLSSVPVRLRPPLSDRAVGRWVDQGWVELAGTRLRCTPEGWLRLDALVGDLTAPLRTG